VGGRSNEITIDRAHHGPFNVNLALFATKCYGHALKRLSDAQFAEVCALLNQVVQLA